MDRIGEHLTQNDAFLWLQEADPLLRSTISGLAMLDCAPDWDRLVDQVQRAVAAIPQLRQRIVDTPLRLATPHWVDDPDLELAYHLRRVRLPEPGDLAGALDVARVSAMAGLDRARPLWEFTLLEGLAPTVPGGPPRAAFHTKLHHVLTDGIGAMQLAAQLYDLERYPERGPEPPAVAGAPPAATGPLGEIASALTHDLTQLFGTAGRLAREAGPATLDALRHPRGTVERTLETARSIARMVEPITQTLSPIMTERRLAWHQGVLEVPVATMKAAARAAGGSLNDAFMAGLAGGLRRYHEAHDTPVRELRFAMPISLRADDDAPGGNHVTLMRFLVPVGIVDPAERIARVGELVREVRSEPGIAHSGSVAGALNVLPPSVVGSMIKHVDVLASNVPGIDVPIHLAGARVERYYPFGPTLGAAVNVTLLSYDGTCCLGVTTDTAAVPDPDLFLTCLGEGFDEVTELAS